MEPVFVDLHIHTSSDPERPNLTYDVDLLKDRVELVSEGSSYLISLTDHNFINKHAYLNAVEKFKHILLGVELHVRNNEDAPPYHCHIFFDLPQIDASTIDHINAILDELYPKKVVSNSDDIPKLEKIMKSFDAFDFLLLPHGGQTHSTFDESIPKGIQFDNTLERSIYYNHFDGFTARSNTKLEKIHDYFDRLGIEEFVNLITATDNYSPKEYPNCKASDASPFIKT